jgi:hypothetical protein
MTLDDVLAACHAANTTPVLRHGHPNCVDVTWPGGRATVFRAAGGDRWWAGSPANGGASCPLVSDAQQLVGVLNGLRSLVAA